jgi:hypothetical protein
MVVDDYATSGRAQEKSHRDRQGSSRLKACPAATQQRFTPDRIFECNAIEIVFLGKSTL